MSYKDAIEDSVKHVKRGNGSTVYFLPCHLCGNEVFSLSYIPGHKYTCDICKLRKLSQKPQSKGMARMRKL